MYARMTTTLGGALLMTTLLATVALAAEPLPLDQAVREGKVWVHVSSLGGSTGNTVNVNVKRMVNEELRVSVAPGTVLVPAGADVQRMAAASVQGAYVNGKWQKADLMVLTDDAQHDFMLEAYCIDYDKPAPRYGDVFTLNVRNDQVQAVLDVAARKAATAVDVQVAIWMQRQRAKGVEVNVGELKQRFPVATDQNIAAARDLLVDVRSSGPSGVSTKVQTGRVLNIPGVDVQVDANRNQTGVKVGAYGFSVNVNAPTPPRVAAGDSRETLQVLHAHKADKYVAAARGTLGIGGAVHTAAAERTFLILSVAISKAHGDVAAEKFSLLLEGQSVPAVSVAMGPALFTANLPPRLPSPLRQRSLGIAGAAIVRYQLVFEVPKPASQGTLRWLDHAEVNWSATDAGSR